jgi:hypothetical protein
VNDAVTGGCVGAAGRHTACLTSAVAAAGRTPHFSQQRWRQQGSTRYVSRLSHNSGGGSGGSSGSSHNTWLQQQEHAQHSLPSAGQAFTRTRAEQRGGILFRQPELRRTAARCQVRCDSQPAGDGEATPNWEQLRLPSRGGGGAGAVEPFGGQVHVPRCLGAHCGRHVSVSSAVL